MTNDIGKKKTVERVTHVVQTLRVFSSKQIGQKVAYTCRWPQGLCLTKHCNYHSRALLPNYVTLQMSTATRVVRACVLGGGSGHPGALLSLIRAKHLARAEIQ